MAYIAEDTSSSISSFQSTSDQSSVAGSLVESPTKNEPLDPFVVNPNSLASSSSSTINANNDNLTETITMTLEDINQFAQDIYWGKEKKSTATAILLLWILWTADNVIKMDVQK